MYRSQVVSRSQRRSEKRQVTLFLLLVLGVALGSFALGVLVGRNIPTVSHGGNTAVKLPVVNPAPPPATVAEPAMPAAPPSTVAPTQPPAQLTFYDTLPKGEKPPLGSGFNVPAGEAKLPAPPAVASERPVSATPEPELSATSVPPDKITGSGPASLEKGAGQAVAVLDGSPQYVLHAASFLKIADAETLAKRLQRKGHTAFVDQSGGNGKSTWYRVSTGPYASAEAAKKAAERLRSEERLSPILRKR